MKMDEVEQALNTSPQVSLKKRLRPLSQSPKRSVPPDLSWCGEVRVSLPFPRESWTLPSLLNQPKRFIERQADLEKIPTLLSPFESLQGRAYLYFRTNVTKVTFATRIC